jgi:hypothetical protein
MAYVPVVPPTSTSPPSPRTRELAGLLSQVLDEYQKAHPATTKGEVRAALKLAQMSAGPDRTQTAALISFGLGVCVFLLALGLFFFRSGGGDLDIPASFPMIIMGLIVLLGIVVALLRLLSR